MNYYRSDVRYFEIHNGICTILSLTISDEKIVKDTLQLHYSDFICLRHYKFHLKSAVISLMTTIFIFIYLYMSICIFV